jgi:hypothetical protein
MTGVEDRVKGFLESWEKIRGNIPIDADHLKCCICDCELKDGGFAILDGDPVCDKCKETMKGV